MTFFQDIIKAASSEDLPKLVRLITSQAKHFVSDPEPEDQERALYQDRCWKFLSNKTRLDGFVGRWEFVQKDLIPFAKDLSKKSRSDVQYALEHRASPHKIGLVFLTILAQLTEDPAREKHLNELKKQIHQLEVAKDNLIAEFLGGMLDEELELVLKRIEGI